MSSEIKLTKWLTEVLKNHNLQLDNVQFPNYNSEGGFAAEIIFANVTAIKQDGEKEMLELLLKKNKDSEIVRKEINLDIGYKNEVNFYSKIIPYLTVFAERRGVPKFAINIIPRCFGTISEENQNVIVLENLQKKGFRMNELKTPHDINHVKLVVQAYATWCAFNLSWKDQEPSIFEEFSKCVQTIHGTKAFELLKTTFHKEIERVVQLYGSKNETKIVDKLKELNVNVDNLFDQCYTNKNENYGIFRHADCWNNNFLFHYIENKTNKPNKTVVIDWQLCYLGSPLADLTQYLFYSCSKRELEHLDEILELYYETFSEKIRELGSDPEKCLPRTAFQESFLKYVPIALAGMPLAVRFSCTTRDKKYEIEKAEEDGDFGGILEGTIEDPEGYYKRMTDIFKFSIDKKFI